MDANTGVALQAKLAGRVAQYADRREDWSGFGFGTGLDPRYARRSGRCERESDHQRRYPTARQSRDAAGAGLGPRSADIYNDHRL